MDSLYWELNVLSQAVNYSNLSGASSHVGLSQPQLSRIIAKIEQGLNVTILDRSARRKSGWTPMAFRLAEAYTRNTHHMSTDIARLIEGLEPTHLKVGTLEGLQKQALNFAALLLELPSVRAVELDVHDIGQLEEYFTKGSLDFIFTFREPGRKKYQYTRRLGYQTLEETGSSGTVAVCSPYEYTGPARKRFDKEFSKILISNSLEIRKNWIEFHGGKGVIPSEVRLGRKPKESDPDVLLIGAETLSSGFWKKISALKLD